MACHYCEGPIAEGDEEAATWSREEERPRPPAPRFGFGYRPAPSTVVATVTLCERCREVCTVRELARLLDVELGKATRRRTTE